MLRSKSKTLKPLIMIEGTSWPNKLSCQKWILVLLLLTIPFTILVHLLDNYMGLARPLRPPFLRATNRVNKTFILKPPNIVFTCKPHPFLPAYDLEERLLLESNRWPETPPIQSNFSFYQTSNPRGSNFLILPKDGGKQWHVGDQLKVMIKMKDFQKNPKKTGGDFIIARLHNPLLHAGVTGQVADHLNGSYSAVFPLLWIGEAAVEVTLIHTSEAITVLRRVAKQFPDRIRFSSIFQSGKTFETSTCNFCLRSTKEAICNFTNIQTGDPWFCYKPKKLDCNTRTKHFMQRFSAKFGPYTKLFQSKINMKVFIPPMGVQSINVLPAIKGVGMRPDISQPGYYFQGVWNSLSSAPVRQFNAPADISECLQNKIIHLYGDSTIKQWYLFLTRTVPDLKRFDFNSLSNIGPFMAIDDARKTIVRFQYHGFSVEQLPPPLPVGELRYVANELDKLAGGAKMVVVIGVWAHLASFPIEFYIRRLQGIRHSVIQLLNRAPDTLVVIRTPNLRKLRASVAWSNSDFWSMEQNRILRAIFKGVNVSLVDAWEMTLAHSLPHDLHPQAPIIKNMMNVLLSYICPGIKS